MRVVLVSVASSFAPFFKHEGAIRRAEQCGINGMRAMFNNTIT